MDARRNEFYNALFGCRKGGCQGFARPGRLRPALFSHLQSYSKKFLLLGDGADLFYSLCEKRSVFLSRRKNEVPAGGERRAGGGRLSEGKTSPAGELVPNTSVFPSRREWAEKERKEG
jgi:hypothetical protein